MQMSLYITSYFEQWKGIYLEKQNSEFPKIKGLIILPYRTPSYLPSIHPKHPCEIGIYNDGKKSSIIAKIDKSYMLEMPWKLRNNLPYMVDMQYPP